MLVETIFVPRGAEERAVRAALPKGSAIRIVATGIGARAADRSAGEALGGSRFGTALVTGLCGALSPAFVVGDALVYREIDAHAGERVLPDVALGGRVAGVLPGAQTGIRAVHSDSIVERASEKRALATRYDAGAVDMESYALVRRLQAAGVATTVVRVASDAARDDLPALGRALDGSGGMDDVALALALLREPRAALRLIRNAMTALRALRSVARSIALAD